ncbi:MAG: type II toxin-antitoxin system prevent-host-death family antitoxin [Gammaproteobacteria bacterium]|nr:type II toxin-antitoxin system prevent-host-death family antitoxin [Gammaproteobacteria bacterium]
MLTLSEAKAKFSEVVKRASLGEDIIITRMGRRTVRITRFEPANPNRRLACWRAKSGSRRIMLSGLKTSPATWACAKADDLPARYPHYPSPRPHSARAGYFRADLRKFA